MTLLIILGALILLFVVILFPRVRVRADVDLTHAVGGIDCLWFSASGDSRQKGFRGRILFFRFTEPGKETAARKAADKAAPPDVAPSEPQAAEPTTASAEPAAEKAAAPPKPKKSGGGVDTSLILGETDLILDLLLGLVRDVKRCFRAIRADYLEMDLTLGLDDAMATGLALGILHPLYFINGGRRRVTLTPVFDGFAFDFRLHCCFSVRPLRVVGVIAWGILTLPWYRLAKLAWRMRKSSQQPAPMPAASSN